jgi:hypothetical protein
LPQDELIDALRTNGRKQAAQRQMRSKRDHGTASGSGAHGANKRGRVSREATATTTSGAEGVSGEVVTCATGGRRNSSAGAAGSQMAGRECSAGGAAAGEGPEAQSGGLDGPEAQSGLCPPPVVASGSQPPTATHSGEQQQQ